LDDIPGFYIAILDLSAIPLYPVFDLLNPYFVRRI
jgi:hypothetical protein